MTEGKLYGVCYVCERTTGSKYSVNNHGRKCTGRAAAIPAVGCRCGVSPIMSTIIQRYRERAEIRRSRRRSRGSRSPYPCGFTRSASFARVYHVPSPFLRRSSSTFSLFLSLSLSLSLSISLSLPPGQLLVFLCSGSVAIVRGRQAAVLFLYQKPQSTSISAPMGPEFP